MAPSDDDSKKKAERSSFAMFHERRSSRHAEKPLLLHVINFLIKMCSCVNQLDKLKFLKQQINCFCLRVGMWSAAECLFAVCILEFLFLFLLPNPVDIFCWAFSQLEIVSTSFSLSAEIALFRVQITFSISLAKGGRESITSWRKVITIN